MFLRRNCVEILLQKIRENKKKTFPENWLTSAFYWVYFSTFCSGYLGKESSLALQDRSTVIARPTHVVNEIAKDQEMRVVSGAGILYLFANRLSLFDIWIIANNGLSQFLLIFVHSLHFFVFILYINVIQFKTYVRKCILSCWNRACRNVHCSRVAHCWTILTSELQNDNVFTRTKWCHHKISCFLNWR